MITDELSSYNWVQNTSDFLIYDFLMIYKFNSPKNNLTIEIFLKKVTFSASVPSFLKKSEEILFHSTWNVIIFRDINFFYFKMGHFWIFCVGLKSLKLIDVLQQSSSHCLHKFFKRLSKRVAYCYDFRYESNGIFVLGWVFFSSDKFRLLT